MDVKKLQTLVEEFETYNNRMGDLVDIFTEESEVEFEQLYDKREVVIQKIQAILAELHIDSATTQAMLICKSRRDQLKAIIAKAL